MRAKEFLIEAAAKVGRDFQHLEDLVFVDGSKGAQQALNYLESFGRSAKNISVKWDGNPTVFWGREPDGSFILVGKNNWDKESQGGKARSPEELEQFINSRGKGEDWRSKFANDMAALWPIFEAATPKSFRGYIFGDLLFHPGKPVTQDKDSIDFTPNQTTYHVKTQSSIGKKIADAKVAVAAHLKLDTFGQSLQEGEPFKNVEEFNKTQSLVVLGQTYVTHQPKVDTSRVKQLEQFVKRHGQEIDQFLQPVAGLSDLKNIIYTYINNMSREKKLNQINTEFFNWLQNSKVSATKQAKIVELHKQLPTALTSILTLVEEIMQVKNDIIAQLDQAEADITASTGGKAGGEGYVSQQDFIKLVPRDRWTPFRAD